MAKLLDRPTTETPPVQDLYQQVCDLFPKHRVELISGRIVVSEMPTGVHNKIIGRLILQIAAFLAERGWEPWPLIKVFMGAQSDRYIPDLVVVASNPRMWGEDEVYADHVLMAVEVVSSSSIHDDYEIKPKNYAAGGVPLLLRIDPLKNTACLFSHPAKAGYRDQHHVEIGEPLQLPEPWNLTLDTGKLID
ncbi:Uma2 family endonuclease [Thermoactinospora rubra]|uniref:Uma2 family endonuclease n=1 Tax=Thermoactinospora rubra TaxID=1088767 RepID=UPI000A110E90|nr:Uma2 family endonuclease [Thermoactinospora rubra]